jgi:hypothetical protein
VGPKKFLVHIIFHILHIYIGNIILVLQRYFVIRILYIIVIFIVSYLFFILIFTSVATYGHVPIYKLSWYYMSPLQRTGTHLVYFTRLDESWSESKAAILFDGKEWKKKILCHIVQRIVPSLHGVRLSPLDFLSHSLFQTSLYKRCNLQCKTVFCTTVYTVCWR